MPIRLVVADDQEIVRTGVASMFSGTDVRIVGERKMCHEHIVCCTGTRFHTCSECRKEIERRVA